MMDSFKAHSNQSNTSAWIKSHFLKRECVCVCPTSKDSNKCGCGRYLASHYYFEEEVEGGHENPNFRWSINKCTATYPTEEFGTLAFQGVHGPNKSHFIRLDFTTDPADIYRLLTEAWGFEPPKLVITVHGGTNNFELPPNVIRALRKGLLKAAKTTKAWIITSGIRMGVVKHIVAALTETVLDRKQKFTVIGILPWGVMRRNEDILNSNGSCVPYYLQSSASVPPSTALSGSSSVTAPTGRSRMAALCEHHSCFLLVDNGTVGRTGAEVFLRHRFEDYVKRQSLFVERSTSRVGVAHHGCSPSRVPPPLVCLVLGGGKSTLQAVLSHVTAQPPVPAVVCTGSGRAADILAYARKQYMDEKEPGEQVRQHIVRMAEEAFSVCEAEGHKIVKTVILCSKWLNMVTVFSCEKEDNAMSNSLASSSEKSDLDCVIMNALLNGHNLSAVDKLGLLLTWNRDDMAREIFERGNHEDWPEGSLNQAMMYALVWDRVPFVQLLLNNGMAMDQFLSITRLEELYNTDRGPPNTLRFIVQDVVKDPGANYRFRLSHVGLIVEKLIGSGYRATYSRQDFRRKYKLHAAQFSKRQAYHQRYPAASSTTNNCNDNIKGRNLNERRPTFSVHSIGKMPDFQSSFDDLFVWAVLTKRHEMAMCMWRQGDDQLAKALIGYKLNKELAKEAEEDYLELEISQQFKTYAGVFQDLAYNLLETCYQMDDALTSQLLTYELKLWNKKTCLSLAALSNHKKFVAHPCCQMLLADLWLGGLRIRKKAHIKVILGILLPPLILCLPFKTQEQLMLQAQTAEEFHENRPDLMADDKCSYASDSSSDNESSGDNELSSAATSAIINDDPGDIEAKLSSQLTRAVCRSSVIDVAADPQSVPPRPRLSSPAGGNLKPARRLTPHRFLAAVAGGSNKSVWFSTSSCTLLQPGQASVNLTTDSSMGSLTEVVETISLGRKPISATKSSLQNETCEFAISSSASDSTRTTQIHGLARNSSDVNVAMLESDADTPLVGQGLILPQGNKTDSRMKPAGRFGASVGNFFSKHLPTFDRHIFDPNAVGLNLLRPHFSPELRKISLKQNQELSLKKKIREFYQAPIACFWSFVVLLQEPNRLLSKWKVYSQQSIWDVLSSFACLIFIVAFMLRISADPQIVFVGRVLYCCNIVFWYMRSLHLLTASSLLGPYITMYGKMVVKMFLLSNILFVVLASFGVFRQSILFPNKTWNWELVRNIVYKPYFMLYGERCEPGHFLVPLFMTIYLLLAIIVFVNMMIAAFNFVFMQVNSQSHLIWKFQRFEQVMEYEQQPFLPPPFLIFAHLYLLCKYVYRRIWKRDKVFRFEHSLKLFLNEPEVEKLHDFERECVEHMFTKQQAKNLHSTEERIKQISDKLESVVHKMDAMYERCSSNRLLMLLLQEKLSGLQVNNSVSGSGAAALNVRNVSVADPTSAAAAVAANARFLNVPPQGIKQHCASPFLSAVGSGAESQVFRRRRLSLTERATETRNSEPTALALASTQDGRRTVTPPVPLLSSPGPTTLTASTTIAHGNTWAFTLPIAAVSAPLLTMSAENSPIDETKRYPIETNIEASSPSLLQPVTDGLGFLPLSHFNSGTNQSLNTEIVIDLAKKSSH